MRIAGTGRALAAGTAGQASRPAAGGGAFRLPAAAVGGLSPASSAAPAATLASLEALMALQAVPDAAERRRRAARRGARLLGALAELQMGLLDGGLAVGALRRLQEDTAAAREASDDPALDGILIEIELRAAVELAKLELAGTA